MITSLDEHQLLVFWMQLFVLALFARSLGALMRHWGQPAVIGELAAGVILGPSVFGKIWPEGFDWFLPADPSQSAALLAIGWIGVVLLLVITGFETDLELVRRNGRAAIMVAGGGEVVPFLLGLGLGFAMPAFFLGDEADRLVFALFMATAMSISALPVVATVLSELKMLRRNFAQLTLAAGMIDDIVGWMLLGIVSGMAASGEVDFASTGMRIAFMAVFVVFAFTLGQRLIDALLRQARQRGSAGGALAITLIATLACALFTQSIHMEAPLGAFVAGIVLGRSRFQQKNVIHEIEGPTRAFFAPVFFATAGLRVDLQALVDPSVIGWAVVVLAIACLGKFAGAFLGSRLARLSVRDGLALGAGLNARGALEIIVATIGLSAGVLSVEAYTVIVVMALATSAMAGPLLKLIVRDWRGSAEEQARLDQEEALKKNVVVNTGRLLVPSRGGTGSIAAAQVLHFAWPREAEVTLMCVGEPDVSLDPLYNVFHEREIDLYRSSSPPDEAVERILLEANLGYGVVGIGVGDIHRHGLLLPGLVNELIQESPIPVVIVRAARNLEGPLPGAFTRALVPVAGGRSSRAAQEIAFNISRQLGTEIHLCHVLQTPSWEESDLVVAAAKARSTADKASVGRQLVEQAASLADELGVRGNLMTDVVHSEATPGEGIVTTAESIDADLVVLGARPRKLEGRPYLGANAEHVLESCDATVVVVVVPEDDGG